MEKKTKLVSFATQKGGAGKTTLTTLIASHLQYVMGYKVAIIDCDPTQYSIKSMRDRDIEFISQNPHYNKLAQKQYSAINNKAYVVLQATYQTAIDTANELQQQQPDLDYIFFDMPGTIASTEIAKVLWFLDHVFVPIVADRVVLESSLNFASILNEILISTNGSGMKGVYMIWNMVDKREKTELYDHYEEAINELGIPVMTSYFPDSKRFRKEVSSLQGKVFRSTMLASSPSLRRLSGLQGVVDEFIELSTK